MEAGELATQANDLLGVYRDALLVDPFYRIKVEIVEGDFISICVMDASSPLTWILRLNPARHDDVADVSYSVFDALLRVLFYALEVAGPGKEEEAKNGLISRLATSLATILSVSEPEPEPIADGQGPDS